MLWVCIINCMTRKTILVSGCEHMTNMLLPSIKVGRPYLCCLARAAENHIVQGDPVNDVILPNHDPTISFRELY